MAVAVELAIAEKAGAAEEIERDQHPVAGLEVLDPGPHFDHLADELVAEGVAHPGVGDKAVVQVQVRSADAGPQHSDNCVVRMFDCRIGLALGTNAIRSPEGHCQHNSPLQSVHSRQC